MIAPWAQYISLWKPWTKLKWDWVWTIDTSRWDGCAWFCTENDQAFRSNTCLRAPCEPSRNRSIPSAQAKYSKWSFKRVAMAKCRKVIVPGSQHSLLHVADFPANLCYLRVLLRIWVAWFDFVTQDFSGHVCQQQNPWHYVRFSWRASDLPNSEVVSIGDVSVQAKDDPSHLAACFATCQNVRIYLECARFKSFQLSYTILCVYILRTGDSCVMMVPP